MALSADLEAAPRVDPELARLQHRNRLRDSALIDEVLLLGLKWQRTSAQETGQVPGSIRKFARYLVEANPSDSFSDFLARRESADPGQRLAAEAQLAAHITGTPDRNQRRVRLALEIFDCMPEERRNARQVEAQEAFLGLHSRTRLYALLPEPERALIRIVRHVYSNILPSLIRFSSKLLLQGHGGIEGWLQMQRDGRGELALRLLKDLFGEIGVRHATMLDRLQEHAGVPAPLRLRIGRSCMFFADVRAGSRPGPLEVNGELSIAEEQPVQAQDSALLPQVPTMPHADAVKWFENRRDDAWLLLDVYKNEGCQTSVQKRRAALDRFGRFLGLESVRTFLTRWKSPFEAVRESAEEQVLAFVETATEKYRSREEHSLRWGLDELVELGVEQRCPNDAALNRAAQKTYPLRNLLPPHEQQILDRVEKEVAIRAPSTIRPCRAALAHFMTFLFSKGHGGLSEWLSMQRDQGLQGKGEAKALLDEFLQALPGSSKDRVHITKPLRFAQDLANLKSQPLVSSQLLRNSRNSTVRPDEGFPARSSAAVSNSEERVDLLGLMRDRARFMAWSDHRQRTVRRNGQAAPIGQAIPAAATPAPDIHALLRSGSRVIDAAVQMQRHPGLGTQRAAFLVDLPAELLGQLLDERGQLHPDVETRLGDVPAEHVAGVSELLEGLRRLQRESAPESGPGRSRASSVPVNRADKGKAVALANAGEDSASSSGSRSPTMDFNWQAPTAWDDFRQSALVSRQASSVGCSLALEAHCGVAPLRHSHGYDSSARLALPSDSGAINRHLWLDATPDADVDLPELKLDTTSEHLSTPVARPPTYVEAELDQARTEFHRLLGEVCDLTGDHAQWSAHFDREERVLVRHQMEPRPENDYKFPLRDPIDPLGSVHKRYAGDDGKCHPNVSIRRTNATNPKGVKLGSGLYSYLQEMAESDDRFRLDDAAGLRDVVARLEDDAVKQLERLIVVDRLEDAQVERLIREEPTGGPCARPRLIEESHVQPHERMLIGQYGLFVRRPENPKEYPTLSKGRILGFYMGALVENRAELAQLRAAHPDYERYAIDARRIKKRRVMYSALGSANSLAFANTALLPEAGKPAFDRKRLNALFIEFEVSLTDRENRPRREHVVALVALDNLFDGDEPEMQVLVDYGETFLAQFQQADGDDPQQREELEVKSEPANEHR